MPGWLRMVLIAVLAIHFIVLSRTALQRRLAHYSTMCATFLSLTALHSIGLSGLQIAVSSRLHRFPVSPDSLLDDGGDWYFPALLPIYPGPDIGRWMNDSY